MLSRVFRYHHADAIVALAGVGHVAFLVYTFLAFPSMSWWMLAFSFLAYALMICWNLQCISHNFIHNPFFRSRLLNRLYGVLETIAIGMPHQLYHHYHMNHHQGDNDAKGPDGTTRDWSSIYRHSRDDNPEPFWRYCLYSFFRVEMGPVLKVAWKHGPANVAQAAAESLALGAFWVMLLVGSWQYFLFFYLPSFFLGWVISYAEGYLEHYGGQPGNPYANSVSSYNWLYNFLWFNNGYHQEHHWDPKRHWTRMRQLHAELRPQLLANNARVLKGPHLTGLIEDWLTGHKPAVAESAPPTLKFPEDKDGPTWMAPAA
jgi:fatty acid desaturase